MTDKPAKRGFTLVEVLVAGVLVSVLVLSGYTIFSMYTNSTRETAANLKMQRQAEGLVDEISRRVRNGSYILELNNTVASAKSEDEYALSDDQTAALTEIPVRQFVIRDNDNHVLSSFRITDAGVVQMSEGSLDEGDFEDFTVDGTPIVVGNDDNSWFGLWYGHSQVRINLTLQTAANNGHIFSLAIQRGVFRCRN